MAVEDGHVDKLTNRFVEAEGVFEYDAAGNVTLDKKFTQRHYSYDASGRQKSVSVDGTAATAYTSVYDGAGQRVATVFNGQMTVNVYDAFGKLVAEYGQPVTNSGIQYVFTDHQGSTRVVTNSQGTVVSRHDYEPFGGEIYGVGARSGDPKSGQADLVRQKYAGMERDEGSSLNHTLWRKQDYLSGRWTSPDPYGGSMTVADPQSFNRYTYVNNDPVNKVDPLGLMLSDIGVYQTYNPQDARIAEQQSLRDLQVSVNEGYAARNGGSITYNGSHATFQPDGLLYDPDMLSSPSGAGGDSAHATASSDDCGCTLQVRGRAGDSLSPGNPLRFPYTEKQTLGPVETYLYWSWQVEISGTVPDDISTWTIRQEVEWVTQRVGKNRISTVFRSSISEDLTAGKYWKTYQPKGGRRFYTLDAPGIAAENYVPAFDQSYRRIANFTTYLEKGNQSRKITWSIDITVSGNNRIFRANFYPIMFHCGCHSEHAQEH